MFYATIDNGEAYTFRFYTKADRNSFVSEHTGGRALTAKQAKFVAGADRCVTYAGRTTDGWYR